MFFSELSESMKTKIYEMAFLVILLIMLIIYLIYRYIYAKENEPVLVWNRTPFNDTKILKSKKIKKSKNGIQLTYSMWLYINNAPENAGWNKSFKAPKTIISQGYSPAIALIPFTNKLIFGITSSCQSYIYDIVFLPSQKWNHVVMIIDNRHVDFFINSKLYKSIMLPYIPDIDSSLIKFFPDNDKLFGYIACTRYFNRALTKNDVITLYKNNSSNNPPTVGSFWWLKSNDKYPYILINILNFILFLPKHLRKILF